MPKNINTKEVMNNINALSNLGKGEIFNEDFINEVSKRHNIYNKTTDLINDKFDKFSPYGFFDMPNISTYFREYIFFTKPWLNFSGSGPVSSYASFLSSQYPQVLSYLTKGGFGFIPLLTNSVVPNNGVDVPDVSVMEYESMQNVYGASIFYAGHSLESKYNTEFTVEFFDSKFIDVYTFFHAWNFYSEYKTLGYIPPKYKGSQKVLDDQISVYKVIVSEDLSTIVYMGKWTGVFPKTLPKSIFQTLEPGQLKLSITFKAFIYEDDNKDLLVQEFNQHSKKGGSGKDSYVGIGTGIDNRFKNGPYIEKGKNNGRIVYKLKWG